MSQHPSLKTSRTGKKLRTVLKRYERFFKLKDKGLLQDGSSVFGMPKLKIIRTKIKKEKAAEKTEDAAAVPAEGVAKEAAPKKSEGKGDKKDKKK